MAADSMIPGIAGGAATAGVIGFFTWLFGRVKRDGKDEAEAVRVEERAMGLRDDILELRDEMKMAVTELRAVAANTDRLQVSQNAVNSMTAKTLDALAAKQDQHAEKLADHASTLRLLTDNVTLMRQRLEQHTREEK